MNEIERQKMLEKVKNKAETTYKKTGSVFCPALNKNINFNTKGLDYIKFKDWNKTRLASEQYLRLKFLKKVPEILKKTTTMQEYKEQKTFERVKSNSKWNKKMVNVKFYGFVSITNLDSNGMIRIKIIVKEIEGGEPYFWSIIPFWKCKKDPILKQTKKVFHDGDLNTQ
jgi:hypothetical protein